MPSLDRQPVEHALARKLALEVEEHKHRRYILRICGLDIVSTEISRGAQKYKTLGDKLVSKMARQLKVRTPEFVGLVRCPLDRDYYLSRLRDQGLIPDRQ